MRALEAFTVAARFIQDADQIHHDIQPLKLALEYSRVVHIGLDHLDGGQHQQLAVTLAMAGEDTHRVAGHDQALTQAVTDKAGPTQYSDTQSAHAESTNLKNVQGFWR